MAEITTFLARNNHTVTVHAPLWSAAQSLIGQSDEGKLLPMDAIRLLAQVDLDPDALDIQRKTLRHIRWYFRWTEPGGKALLYGLKRAGQWRWTLPGLNNTLKEVAEAFEVEGPVPSPHLPSPHLPPPDPSPSSEGALLNQSADAMPRQEAITLRSGPRRGRNKS